MSSSQPPRLTLCMERPRRFSSSVAFFSSAAWVNGGILPFGGSTISDVRLVPTVFVPLSTQKLL